MKYSIYVVCRSMWSTRPSIYFGERSLSEVSVRDAGLGFRVVLYKVKDNQ